MRELFGKRYAARSHRPPLACRHLGLPRIVARLGVPDRSLVAHRQLVAAFRAAPRQNCPAILARHASTETMSLRPFAVIGLKCTFWHLGSIATGRRAPVARPCTIMDSAIEPSFQYTRVIIGEGARLAGQEGGMRNGHLQVLLRHPDAVALTIIAMTVLSRASPPYVLLSFVGLI
jgi:hypothetical protein